MGIADRVRRPMNASRVHLDAFVQEAARAIAPGAMVLDAGAGDRKHQRHFDHAVYESADLATVDASRLDGLTYACDLTQIPVPDARFDAVIITQVLEHLPEPLVVLHELRRVLKPSGRIWASCPFYYHEHETPFDFYRYTQFALRRMFEKAGFTAIEIGWLEGYWQTVGYQLELASQAVPRRVLPVKAALRLASDLCARHDLAHKRTDIGHPKNYTVTAVATSPETV